MQMRTENLVWTNHKKIVETSLLDGRSISIPRTYLVFFRLLAISSSYSSIDQSFTFCVGSVSFPTTATNLSHPQAAKPANKQTMISNSSVIPTLHGANITLDRVHAKTHTRDRRTKIVCTMGPASWSKEGLGKLMDAGMNVARFNFSHGDHAGHGEVLERLRDVAEEKSRNIAGTLILKRKERGRRCRFCYCFCCLDHIDSHRSSSSSSLLSLKFFIL